MPRRPRPRRLSDADLLAQLVLELVPILVGEIEQGSYVDQLWREVGRRQLTTVVHRPACVCQDCVAEWEEGIHQTVRGPF